MIALDLDNTILCYDEAFRSAVEEFDCLPPPGLPLNKATVKAAALAKGGNVLWTKLQGFAYGHGIVNAHLFPGCTDFIRRASMNDEKLVVISHKTMFPANGPKVNLRAAAIQCLNQNLFDPAIPVIFCDSRDEKVSHLQSLKCRAVVDDLPEVLETPGFPGFTQFVLFDPTNSHPGWSASRRVNSWIEAAELLMS